MTDQTDAAIALEVQRGNAHIFGLLVERYEPKIARYARRFLFGYDDVQDVVQEVFIKAFMNIQSFDARRPFSPWLYRIAHNLFINAIKKRGKENLRFFDTDTFFPHPHYEDPDTLVAEHPHIKKMLDEGLDKVDPKYREPLILYYYEEVDYKEIAEIMQIPISTVGIRLRRGKEALKKILREKDPHNTLYE